VHQPYGWSGLDAFNEMVKGQSNPVYPCVQGLDRKEAAKCLQQGVTGFYPGNGPAMADESGLSGAVMVRLMRKILDSQVLAGSN
jgi:hypothetical protein